MIVLDHLIDKCDEMVLKQRESTGREVSVSIERHRDFLVKNYLASGALTQVMTRYRCPEAGIYVVRPPGQLPARKIRALTELMIQHFG